MYRDVDSPAEAPQYVASLIAVCRRGDPHERPTASGARSAQHVSRTQPAVLARQAERRYSCQIWQIVIDHLWNVLTACALQTSSRFWREQTIEDIPETIVALLTGFSTAALSPMQAPLDSF